MKLINKVEEYWDRRPCNIKHSSKSVGSIEYFNEVEKRKYFVEPHILSFADFKKWKGKKVLEIGCGIGTDSTNFARAGAVLSVVEISEKSLAITKKRLKVFGLSAKCYLGNAEKLSTFVPLAKYDLIYSFGVIHHTPNPNKVFAEIKKYCSEKTEVRVMLYSKFSFKVLWIILRFGKGAFWKIDELMRLHSEAQIGSPVSYCFTLSEIKRLMNGFKIVKIWKDHIFPYKIDKYRNYQYEKVWYFNIMPKIIFRWLEKNFGWHTLIIARYDKQAK